MTFNMDCVRDVLLFIEKEQTIKNNKIEPIFCSYIYKSLAQYSNDTIRYSLLKLKEANFITGNIFISKTNVISATSIDDITYDGHNFLNSIRPQKTWDIIKSTIISQGKALTVSSITQVANMLIQKEIEDPRFFDILLDIAKHTLNTIH